MLSDSRAEVRREAAKGLERIGDPSSLEALQEAMGDDDLQVAKNSLQAIRAIKKRMKRRF